MVYGFKMPYSIESGHCLMEVLIFCSLALGMLVFILSLCVFIEVFVDLAVVVQHSFCFVLAHRSSPSTTYRSEGVLLHFLCCFLWPLQRCQSIVLWHLCMLVESIQCGRYLGRIALRMRGVAWFTALRCRILLRVATV